MRCQACGAEIPDETYNICPECGQNPGTGEEGENAYVGVERDQPVFENWREIGLPSALFETCKSVLLEPASTFSRMKLTGYENPIIFAAIVAGIGAFFGGIWSLFFQGAMMSLVPNAQQSGGGGGAMMIGGVIGIPIGVIVGVVGAVLSMFIGGGISHLVMKLLKYDAKPYEATARIYGYAAAGNILQVVPIVGGFVAGIWALVVLIIGLREVHGLTTGKAALVIFLPTIVCCVCAMMFGGMGAIAGLAAGAGTTP